MTEALSPEARRLLFVLENEQPHREVYWAPTRCGWFVTHGRGQFSAEAVKELVASGKIVSVYSNCPNDSYHVGRTLDIERTLEVRKQLGKKAAKACVFVGDEP